MSEHQDPDDADGRPRTMSEILCDFGIDVTELEAAMQGVLEALRPEEYLANNREAQSIATAALDVYMDQARMMTWGISVKAEIVRDMVFHLLVGRVWAQAQDYHNAARRYLRAYKRAREVKNMILAGEIAVFIDEIFVPGLEFELFGHTHRAALSYQNLLTRQNLSDNVRGWLHYLVAYNFLQLAKAEVGPGNSSRPIYLAIAQQHVQMATEYFGKPGASPATIRLEHDISLIR
jgi:hypothetical protein